MVAKVVEKMATLERKKGAMARKAIPKALRREIVGSVELPTALRAAPRRPMSGGLWEERTLD